MVKTRIARMAICAAALVVATFLFAWFIGGLIPGKPQVSGPSPGPDSIKLCSAPTLADADLVEVPAGETAIMESATWESDDFNDSLLSELQVALAAHGVLSAEKAEEAWRFDMSDMQFQVVDAKVVDRDSFEQWYPHYADMLYALPGYGSYETKYVVVKATVGNLGEVSEVIVLPWLFSPKFAQAGSAGFLGSSTTPLLVEEMQGSPQESSDTRQYALEEGWNVIEPGSACEVDLAFPVYRSMFSSSDDFDDLGVEDLALQFADCDPEVVYRFMLG